MNEREIFIEALERRDPDERKAWLDEACGDDADLRQRVESLLRAHADAGSFLEKSPAELESPGVTDPATGVPLSQDGSAVECTVVTGNEPEPDDAWQDLLQPIDRPDRLGRLGQYEVIESVGRGGMGVVLRAFDPKLSRIVAVKLLAPEFAASATAVQRFLREARAAAAVSHDHVVSIFAIDDETRPPLIVMELIDGQSLQQKIDSTGPLDVRSILRIGMQTAAGLSAAHRQGLVHRDIKPANILLENGIEKVKLTDFGLARAVDDIGVTRTGQITGTPQYMSPEQAQGQQVDHRTDLFSLGDVLYAMCTGRAAFRADSAVAVMHRVVHDEPRPIRELNEDIPEWLCAIVEKLLAKDPDDRFASAVEVEELLGRHLAHLQQPESVPMPARLPAAPVVKHKGPLSPALERKLNSVSLTFLAVGVAAFATAFFSYAAVDQSWYPGATIVCALAVIATLIVFPIVIFAAIRLNWLILLGRTPGNEVMLASKVALIPWSPFLLLTLPVAIRAARIIKRPDVQAALGREDTGKMSDSATSDDGEDDPQPRAPDEGAAQRHWLRRVPIPAWIALLLFLMVYVGAIVEWSGQDAISSRGNGVVFYLLGSGFVLVWGGCSLAARLIHGSGANASSLAPTRRQLATFFTAVIVLTGVFVWQWAELHSETGREQMRAFLFGAGVITLELPDSDIDVAFNGTKIEVPADGVVSLPLDQPGSYVVAVYNEEGSVNGGEFLVKAGARVKSGVLARARRVVVTGPARGRLPGSASGTAAASGLADLPSSYALRFDGQTGAVELPFGYRGTHPLTIEAWVTVESLSGTDNLTIVSDVDNTGITLFVSSKGHVFFGPAGGTPLAISESPLPLGKRVHIAAVFDRPHVRLYVNGRLAGTAEVPDYRESPLRLVIGANPNNPGYSEHFHGQIDEVHFSNVARYEEDFDPQNRFFADDATLALYHCEDDSGDVVRDASRNGLNGRWIQRPAD